MGGGLRWARPRAVVEVWLDPSVASGSTGNREADCGEAAREGGHREVKGERGWTPPVSDGVLAHVLALREEFGEKGERSVCQAKRDTEEAKLPEIDEGRAGKAEEHLQPAVLLGLGDVRAATASSARSWMQGGCICRCEVQLCSVLLLSPLLQHLWLQLLGV